MWWTIEHDELDDDDDDDDRSVVRQVDDVVTLKCQMTAALSEDGIVRNGFVVWLLQEPRGPLVPRLLQ